MSEPQAGRRARPASNPAASMLRVRLPSTRRRRPRLRRVVRRRDADRDRRRRRSARPAPASDRTRANPPGSYGMFGSASRASATARTSSYPVVGRNGRSASRGSGFECLNAAELLPAGRAAECSTARAAVAGERLCSTVSAPAKPARRSTARARLRHRRMRSSGSSAIASRPARRSRLSTSATSCPGAAIARCQPSENPDTVRSPAARSLRTSRPPWLRPARLGRSGEPHLARRWRHGVGRRLRRAHSTPRAGNVACVAVQPAPQRVGQHARATGCPACRRARRSPSAVSRSPRDATVSVER